MKVHFYSRKKTLPECQVKNASNKVLSLVNVKNLKARTGLLSRLEQISLQNSGGEGGSLVQSWVGMNSWVRHISTFKNKTILKQLLTFRSEAHHLYALLVMRYNLKYSKT